MGKSAAYFFAEATMDYALWAGMAEIIREVKPQLPLVLIHADEPKIRDYDWGPVFERFDRVEQVGSARYEGDSSVRGLLTAWTRGFSQARKVASEMRRLEFEPDSLAFVYSGLSLNQALFLRRVQSEQEVRSVLLSLPKPDLHVDDFTPMYGESLFRNLYLNYFGTGYIDAHALRTPEAMRTGQRDFRYWTRPADVVFRGELPHRRPALKPGQVYCPLYTKNGMRRTSDDGVLLLGTMFEWEPYLSPDRCYRRFNEVINLIRRKYSGARLVYKPHPGESEAQRSRLDLSGFEVSPSVSAETLVMQDLSISVAYAFESIATHTLVCYGVRTHVLYPLFDEKCIPDPLRRCYDTYLMPRAHPEMAISSVDDWMNGLYDYQPADMSKQVRASAIGMLERAGVLSEEERKAFVEDDVSRAVPEERWAPMPRVRTAKGALWIIISTIVSIAVDRLTRLPRRVFGRVFGRSRVHLRPEDVSTER